MLQRLPVMSSIRETFYSADSYIFFLVFPLQLGEVVLGEWVPG